VWNHLKPEGSEGGGKRAGRTVRGHIPVEVLERAAGIVGIRRTGRGDDGELLLLNEDGNETILVFDQMLLLPRTGGEGGVMRRLLGGDMKKLAVRQHGRLSISLRYDHS
jgi:hypothetical protein